MPCKDHSSFLLFGPPIAWIVTPWKSKNTRPNKQGLSDQQAGCFTWCVSFMIHTGVQTLSIFVFLPKNHMRLWNFPWQWVGFVHEDVMALTYERSANSWYTQGCVCWDSESQFDQFPAKILDLLPRRGSWTRSGRRDDECERWHTPWQEAFIWFSIFSPRHLLYIRK